MVQVAVDGLDQVGDALERPTANAVARDLPNQRSTIEPAATVGNEVKVHPGMASGASVARAGFCAHSNCRARRG
jgi:hypothetical protein